MKKANPELWQISVEAWKTGAVVTDFMRDQIATLRGSDGELLPESAREFLADLVFLRINPRKGRPISKTAIRESYRQRLFNEQVGDPGLYNDGSPKDRAIRSIATELNLSERVVSGIVHPRKRKT